MKKNKTFKDNPNYLILKNNIKNYQKTVYNPDFKLSNNKKKIKTKYMF